MTTLTVALPAALAPAQHLAALCSQTPPERGVLLDWRVLDHGFHLDLLLTPYRERGTGIGERALAAVCTFADAAGAAIHLDAADCMGADMTRLVGWYRRHGFIAEPTRTPEDPRSIAMVRHPHLLEER